MARTGTDWRENRKGNQRCISHTNLRIDRTWKRNMAWSQETGRDGSGGSGSLMASSKEKMPSH